MRFHAFQSIAFSVVAFALHLVLIFIPIIGWIISIFLSLAFLVLWIIVMLKALKGESGTSCPLSVILRCSNPEGQAAASSSSPESARQRRDSRYALWSCCPFRCNTLRRLVGCWRRNLGYFHVVIQSALFVDVGLDDLRGDLGGELAPFPVLEEDRDSDVWIPARRDAHEPGVGHSVMTLVGAGKGVVADDLGGAGLAGEVDPLEVSDGGGAGGGDRGHALGDGLPSWQG